MDTVLCRPWSDEVEDYAEYKRIRKQYRDKQSETASPTSSPTASPTSAVSPVPTDGSVDDADTPSDLWQAELQAHAMLYGSDSR
jgi:hypothetical protein